MPAPQVTCSICNQTVMKAQTSHIGEGKRACKIHDDVAAKAKEAQSQLNTQHKNGRKIPPPKKYDNNTWLFPTGPTCACCRKPVVNVKDLILEAMIIRRELNLNIFSDTDNEIVRKRLVDKFGEFKPFYLYHDDTLDEKQWKLVKQWLPNYLKTLADVKMVGICLDCSKAIGLPDLLEKQRKTMPMPPLNVLAMIGAGMESTMDGIIANRLKEAAVTN